MYKKRDTTVHTMDLLLSIWWSYHTTLYKTDDLYGYYGCLVFSKKKDSISSMFPILTAYHIHRENNHLQITGWPAYFLGGTLELPMSPCLSFQPFTKRESKHVSKKKKHLEERHIWRSNLISFSLIMDCSKIFG